MSEVWLHLGGFHCFCIIIFLFISLYLLGDRLTHTGENSAAVLYMIPVYQWPVLCHSLCREDSKGVRLLSLRAPFDHMYHSAAH